MKIVIPMAGERSRFKKAGYTFPKPLIDVEGSPMIERVVNNFSQFDADFIFLVRKEHLLKYNVDTLLRTVTKNRCEIIPVDELTEGAACTVLLAKDLINSGESLLIANSDQLLEYRFENFQLMRNFTDGFTDFIWTFNATNPKWSFVRTDNTGRILEVAEKNPISNIATCGVYYWEQGSAFVSCVREMIANNTRVNGEFYVCPVHNVAIARGRKVYPFYVDKMWGLGTPEDLEAYLNR